MSKKQPIVAEVQQTGNALIAKLNELQTGIQSMQDNLKSKENELKQKLLQQKKAIDEQRQLEAERLIKMAEDEKASRKNKPALVDQNDNEVATAINQNPSEAIEPDTIATDKAKDTAAKKETISDKQVRRTDGNQRPRNDKNYQPRQQGEGGNTKVYVRPQGDRQQSDRYQGDKNQNGYKRFDKDKQQAQGGYQKDRPQGNRDRNDKPQRSSGYSKPAAPVFDIPVEKERVSNYDPNKKLYRNNRDTEKKMPNKKELARQQSNRYGDDDVWRGKKKKKESAQSKMEPIKLSML